jgi:general secretion pathway protein G
MNSKSNPRAGYVFQRNLNFGFTLLELLVVVAILGMLAAVIGPRYLSQLSQSESKVAKVQITAIAKAIEAYRIDMGSVPTTEQGLM